MKHRGRTGALRPSRGRDAASLPHGKRGLGAARGCRWPCDSHPASEPCVPHPVGAPHWPAPERARQEAHQSERRADQLFNFLKSRKFQKELIWTRPLLRVLGVVTRTQPGCSDIAIMRLSLRDSIILPRSTAGIAPAAVELGKEALRTLSR